MASDVLVSGDANTIGEVRKTAAGGSLARHLVARIRRDPLAIASAIVLLVVIGAAIAATSLDYSYADQDLTQRNASPSRDHYLGTDKLGRDVFARIAYGARVSMTVAFAATAITLVLGVVVGSIAGYIGGRTDAIAMRLVDAMYAFPDLLFVILVSALIRGQVEKGPSGLFRPLKALDEATSGLLPVFLALGLTSWLTCSRIVRAQILSLKNAEYVTAARSAGATGGHVIRRHLFPNLIAILIVSATLAIPNAILLEAGLSFIGLGVQPPMPSWGIMLSDGVASIRSFPHLMLIPALAIGLSLLAFNLLGEALRDAVDPLLQRSR